MVQARIQRHWTTLHHPATPFHAAPDGSGMVQQGEKVRCSGSTCAAHGNVSVVSGSEQHQVCSTEPFRASSHAAALTQCVCVCVQHHTMFIHTWPRVYRFLEGTQSSQRCPSALPARPRACKQPCKVSRNPCAAGEQVWAISNALKNHPPKIDPTDDKR